jgi:hypothetical protein
MFIVTAHSGGSLYSVESAKWELRNLHVDGKTKIEGDSLFQTSKDTALMLCMMVKQDIFNSSS